MAFRDPEDLNKDVLQKNSVIFDVKILPENWHARQTTIWTIADKLLKVQKVRICARQCKG